MDENMNKGMRKVWAVWNYVEALILITAGILAIVFRENDTLQKIVSYVIGGFVILDGVLRFILVLAKYQKSQGSIVLISALEITLGILIILLYNSFIDMAVQFLFIFLMTIGGLFLIYSIYAIVRKYAESLFMPVLEIVFAAIMIGLGVTICILWQQDSAQFRVAIMITLGVVLIMVGFGIFAITTATLVRLGKKPKQTVVDQEKIEEQPEVKAEPVQPEVVDVDAEEKKAKEEQPKQKKKFSLPWSKKKEEKPAAIEHKKPEEELPESDTAEPVDPKKE